MICAFYYNIVLNYELIRNIQKVRQKNITQSIFKLGQFSSSVKGSSSQSSQNFMMMEFKTYEMLKGALISLVIMFENR